MVCMLITLLSGTCLPGYADAAGINFRKDTAVLYHALHTGIYCIPGGWRDSFDLLAFGFIFFLDCAIHLFYPVEQRKLVESSLICNCCNISCKLACRKVVVALSHSRTYRVFRRYLRICFRYFKTRRFTQTEHLSVFFQLLQTDVTGIGSVFLNTQLITQVIKIFVTGIGYTADDIHGSVTAGIDPAANRWADVVINTVTVNCRIKCNRSLRQTGYSWQRLISRTGCCRLLSGTVVKRQRGIRIQFIEICTVHRIGQAVVIISRIGNTCQHITVIRIGNHHRSWTRL